MIVSGHIDIVSPELISGWAISSTNPRTVLKLRLCHGGREVSRSSTLFDRPDVARHFDVIGYQKFGFSFVGLPADKLAEGIEVEVLTDNGWQSLIPKNTPSRYQSIDKTGDGASNSQAKLEALCLSQLATQPDTPPLRGKRILDLGCNEGFFCREAITQGAASAHGVDRSSHFIEAARRLVPKATFANKSWWEVRSGQYDVIFFLSAIHYEDRQRELLRHLSGLLAPGGTLVLECGVGPPTIHGSQAWHVIKRHDGPMRYPTRSYLEQTLLADYSIRYIGPSVMQSGDPVPRHVYHCRRKKTSAILVHGESGIGKTALTAQIAHNQNSYSTDNLLNRLFNDHTLNGLPIRDMILNKCGHAHFDSAADMMRKILELGLTKDLGALLVQELPLDLDLIIIEGQALSYPELRSHLLELLKLKGVSAWELTLGGAPPAAASSPL
ncbi:class I SAM-dependent methyltransferase [Ottowia thiooxydans]|uniref:class I SAM-dependent methyltransferase n=1 Tax=Ottowia thiooxydans TaxID=219182 RepID=UPI00040B3924|nr:class I SAM-dependent methyltransferase [Ottowia thiooxydans]